MIAFLRGILTHRGRETITIDVNGVGYMVRPGRRYLVTLPSIGEEITIHTYLSHREDSMELYGFESPEERELFLSLLGVSGIGARTALGILSELSIGDIVTAIISNQPKILAAAPGIGPKTAQRLILELKEKLAKWHPQLPASQQSRFSPELLEDVELTLMALGYTDVEIQKNLSDLLPSMGEVTSAEEIIRAILERLS